MFHNKTKILTQKGWKQFHSLKRGHEVLTRDADDRRVRYRPVDEVQKRSYYGQLYHQENQSLDFAVTPAHRIYTQKVNTNLQGEARYGGLRERTVEDIKGKQVVYDTGFNWEGTTIEEFILPQTNDHDKLPIPIKSWLRFFGWYITEGYVKQRKQRPNNYRVGFSQSTDSEWVVELENALEDVADCLDIEVAVRDEGDVFRYELFNKQLASHLDEFGKSREKWIPNEFKQLTQPLLRTLFSALIRGDGQYRKETRQSMRYFTRSETLADDIQEIALKCGYASVVSEQPSYDRYVVGITEGPRVHVNHSSPTGTVVNYSGPVWSLNIPGDDIVFVRRNGKPVWSGT